MFNWLKKFFAKKKPVLDPELYGGAGGRVPYPPYDLVQERHRHRAGYVGLCPLPGPIPPPPPAPPLPTVYFYGQPIESSLERPSAWPPLDEIEPRSSD
jgi:hypothetical protein